MEKRDSGVTVLRPPGSLRALAWVVAGLAVVLAALAVLLLLTQVIIPGCCLGIAVGVLAVVVTPILAGRVEVRGGELTTRADPAKTYTLPWTEISAVQTRRRLLTEVIAVRRGDVWLELGAPRRWRFRADPGFTAAADDLARRARVTRERGGRRTSAGKLLVRAVLAALYVVVFVTLDPMWHSPLWPGRAEAAAVPRACPVIAADGARLVAGRPEVRRNVLRGADDDRCAYDDALTLEYTRYTYAIGRDGGIEQARRAYTGWLNDHRTTTPRPVTGLGDEAATVVTGRPGTATTVLLAARRANVLVQLTYRPKTGELGGTSVPAATTTAHRLATTAIARIQVR